MISYEVIKAMAKEKKCSVKDLLALAPKNDPYYAGSEGSRQKAEWFYEIWLEFGYDGKIGIHLCRVHYQLVSQPNPLRWDGKEVHCHLSSYGSVKHFREETGPRRIESLWLNPAAARAGKGKPEQLTLFDFDGWEEAAR